MYRPTFTLDSVFNILFLGEFAILYPESGLSISPEISNWTPFKLGSLNVGIFVHFVKRITLILLRFRLSPNNVEHGPIIIEVRMSLVRLESLSIFLIRVLQCRQPAYNTTLTTNCRRMPFMTRNQSIGDKTAPCWCVSFHTFHCKGSFPFKDYWSVFLHVFFSCYWLVHF